MDGALRTPSVVLLAWTLCGCSDHTLVGNIYKSPDTGTTTDIVEDTDDTIDDDSADDSGEDTDDSGSEDTADDGPDRLEGTLNLSEGDWTARRVGELTAFQPKIHLATADLNGDGAAEAVVGAPGWLDPADHGAVYIAAGPISGDGLLADEVRLDGDDRIQYAGFTVEVGTPASEDYPVVAIGSYISVPDVFLVHGPITASGSLSAADGSIQYTSPSGTAAFAGRDVSWLTHATDTWLLSGDPLTLDGRGAVRIHAGPFTGRLDQNGIGLIGGPTQGSFDNPPHLSCHTSTTDASGAPVLYAAAPGVSDSRGAIFRVPLLGGPADLPVELDDTEADNRVVGTAPGDMIGVFDDGWRCLMRTGDINGDGLDDVVIGAPHHDREAGMAWVLDGTAAWGGGSITDSPALLASVPGDVPDTAETPSSCDGSCVGFGVELGDWNGDGAAELVVGRIRDFGAASLVWYGPVSGTLTPRSGEAGSPGLLVKGSGTEMRFADGDADGDMDLFLAEGTKQYDDAGALLGQGGVWMITGE
ncbi:MAG: hypothetical protein CL927_14550 [Deltaproteobacteria bacterium]|nr:hypothetical protein [Deltaproteobacteria bacterium]HCH63822.1 hypothetical protein [Deltaproteobacteria bacterium]